MAKILPRIQAHQATGPLIDQKAVEKMEHYVTDAIDKGAHLLFGAEPPEQGSNFYPVTVLTSVPQEADIESGEIFGPFFGISTFSDDNEALTRANAVTVGLASYVFTTSAKRVHHYTTGLEFGMVGVNTGLISFAGAPFGGYKDSGFAREGATEGLDAYLETKYIAIQH